MFIYIEHMEVMGTTFARRQRCHKVRRVEVHLFVELPQHQIDAYFWFMKR